MSSTHAPPGARPGRRPRPSSAAGARLLWGGCDTTHLARRYGTPLYLLDEDMVRERCRAYRRGLEAHYPGPSRVVYAAKALLTADLCRLVAQEGLWLDATSGGELTLARASGFDPARVLMHGNNKTTAEMRLALRMGVGRLVVDSLWEMDELEAAAASLGRIQPVMLRVAPGVDAPTHAYLRTGQAEGKFGLPLEGGAAAAAVDRAAASPWLKLTGIHAHVGSQLVTLEPLLESARRLIDFSAWAAARLKAPLDEINLGGGLGIRYTDEAPPPVDELCRSLGQAVASGLRSRGLPLLTLMVEPGRSIVGEAGLTLYTVGGTKETPGGLAFLSVDGGMGDNPRPALYGARYRAVLANRAAEPPTRRYQVVGRYCEGDLLIADCPLPEARPGDILAVFATGAYHHAMASNYNLVPRPALVALSGGRPRLSVRRETYRDLLRREAGLSRPWQRRRRTASATRT
ncbi:MAG: diaminopimelate decarboxylase [Acetobacteraceae bacterium]|nr:diaminopimelate decarboxylase [Acetobacteraceae bacterium]